MKSWKKQFGIWVPDKRLSDERGFLMMASGGAIAGSRRRTAAFGMSDDFVGSNGDAWSSAKWTVYNESTSLADIQSNSGRMVASGAAYRTVAATGKTGNAADMTLTVAVTAGQTTESYVSLVIRCASTVVSGDCYRIQQNLSSTTMEMYRRISGSNTLIGFAFNQWTVGTSKQWIKFQCVGTTIRSKCWLYGNSEPGSWGISVTDSNITAAGVAGVTVVNGNISASRSATFNEFSVV